MPITLHVFGHEVAELEQYIQYAIVSYFMNNCADYTHEVAYRVQNLFIIYIYYKFTTPHEKHQSCND